MIKTYAQAVKFLEQFIPDPTKKYLGKFGFDRMQYFMDLLGNPERSYKTIHVGGTSGKGSTSTITASILATRYTVGLTISPHLVNMTERISLFRNNKRRDISNSEFVSLLNEIVPFIQKMKKSVYGFPSHFEILIALAFLFFQKEKVHVGVVEVGMGGRFDGTNVILPRVSVLTNVGLDHTQVLGDTVEKIACDKVGIVKKDTEVVSGVTQPSVTHILEQQCIQRHARLSLIERDFSYSLNEVNDSGSTFDYMGNKNFQNLRIPLLGAFQVKNATLSIRACELFDQSLLQKDIQSGLLSTSIFGRMELIQKNPTVILDGAHNDDKIAALVSSIQIIFPDKKVRLLLSLKNDKDYKRILKRILPISSDIVLTTFRMHGDIGEIVSHDPEILKKEILILDPLKHVGIESSMHKAYTKILGNASENDIILVTGSFYLVGEIKKNI